MCLFWKHYGTPEEEGKALLRKIRRCEHGLAAPDSGGSSDRDGQAVNCPKALASNKGRLQYDVADVVARNS